MSANAKQIFWDILKYASLVLGSFVILFPVVSVAINSLKSDQAYNNTGILQLPSHPDWHNYVLAFTEGALGQAFGNTIIIVALSVVGNIILGTMVAYILGRFEFRFKKVIMAGYLVVMFIPQITTQVATFGVIKNLGLFDTRFAPVLLNLGTDVVQLFIYLQFINRIPVSLDENAMMEGASYLRIYRSIIFPLLLPATATVTILKTISIYGDFYTPFLYMPSTNLGVVSTSLFRFKGPYSAHWNLICAAVIIIAIPTIILFLVLQRYIFAGVINGSVRE